MIHSTDAALKDKFRDVALALHVYRAAQWSYRHLFDRPKLRRITAERGIYGQVIRHNDLVFDVGANIGFKSALFLGLGARVVAFEPQLAIHRELRALRILEALYSCPRGPWRVRRRGQASRAATCPPSGQSRN